MTDKSVAAITMAREERPWLFYDGDCSLCVSAARRFAPLLVRAGFSAAPLQSPRACRALRRSKDDAITEMQVWLPNGQTAGGVDALLLIARNTTFGWPLVLVSHLPGVKPRLRAMYRQIAARRHCFGGACAITSGTEPATTRASFESPAAQLIARWLALIFLVSAVFLLRKHVAAWVFMWTLAGAMFMGLKWATLHILSVRGEVSARRALPRLCAYLFLWPGMDARPFFSERLLPINSRSKSEWIKAIWKVILGAALLLIAARDALFVPLLRGWIGMLGILLFLHFGIFDVIANALRGRGIHVESIMRHPLAATSVGDFWGRRWNTAFSQLSRDLFLPPLRHRFRIGGATLGVFFISGLLHELVISVPARGGYGLPTVYFLLQGAAVISERKQPAQGMGRPMHRARGWLLTVIVAGGPAFVLFHPPFIHHVILPMLDAIGAFTKAL